MNRLFSAGALAAVLCLPTLGATPIAAASPLGFDAQSAAATHDVQIAAKHFKNCTALNKVYRHGVGKPDAVDHVRGHTRRVTNFYVSKALYKANKGSDRDHDGIACEKL